MTTEKNEIRQSVTIDHPADRVYAALTEPEMVAKWFPSSAKADVREGGRYAYAFRHAPDHADRDHDVEGEYRALEPGRRVAYTWQSPGLATATLVTWQLTEEGGRTRVDLTHSGWPAGADEAIAMHDQGWAGFVANLKSVMESGKDARSEWGLVTSG